MSKRTCILYPEAPNGEPSRMYRKLLERLKDRPLANWFYAVYNVRAGQDMDNAGIERNRQGEHNADDVLKFLDYATIANDIGTLNEAELQLGAVDINGNRIDYTNAEDALTKAKDFNNNHKGLVATVVQHGDIYNIIVSEKNSKTHAYVDTVSDDLKIWDIYKQVFNAKSIDITAMPQELQGVFNALNTGLGQYLKNLAGVDIGNLYKRDAMILFSLSPNSPHVKRIINAFGSIENAAQALDDFNHGARNLTGPQQVLMMRAINDAKKFQGINMDNLIHQVRDVISTTAMYSPEEDIKDELRRLDKKYKTEKNEIHRTSAKIRTLSDVAADAAVTLQRQIRQLEKERGNNTEGRRVESILNKLMKELENKKYYSGVLNFLGEASSQIANIDTLLQSIPQTGTELEKAFNL